MANLFSEFFEKTKEMRQAQKDYFIKGRKQATLVKSKTLEAEVDQLVFKIDKVLKEREND